MGQGRPGLHVDALVRWLWLLGFGRVGCSHRHRVRVGLRALAARAVKGVPCGLLCSGRCGTWRWRMSRMPGSSGMTMWWSGSLPAHCAALIFICTRVVLGAAPGMVLGHEGMGIVEAVGPAVHR